MNPEPDRETNNLLRALGFSVAFIIAWITGFLPPVASTPVVARETIRSGYLTPAEQQAAVSRSLRQR